MYDFIDTIEIASEGAILPSEALSINGEYIENLIEGYRTLTVTGREALSPELDYFETGVRDGSVLQGKRYPARIITVKYQLVAKSNEEFRGAFNKLNGILNVENAELIFNDETDKFFTGTLESMSEVNAGSNSVIGEFSFLCADPFKYSVVEYVAEPTLDDSSILIDYNGTYKAYPILEADFFSEDEASDDGDTKKALTGSGDCGYVAFFNENEKIIQLGDPKEEDTESYAKSQTLVNQKFDRSGAWGLAAKDLWAANSAEAGSVFPYNVVQDGSLKMKVAAYTSGAKPATSGTLLKNVKSTASVPVFYYNVTAKATDRTSTSVKVKVSITASLGTSTNYFGNGLGLKASVYLGGAWHSVTLKKTSDYWRGKSGHTVNLTVTVKDLTESTNSLTGIKFKVERTDDYGNAGKLGETKCSNLTICKYEAPTPSSYYLAVADYGTASGKWHGASITRTIPADEAGDIGANNFTFTFKNKLCIGNGENDAKQLGAFQIQLVDADGVVIAGVRIRKNKAGKKGTLFFYVNGDSVFSKDIDLSYNNKYFGKGETGKTSSITKLGKKVTFNIGGYKKTFSSTAINKVPVTKITVMFEQYSTSTALSYNGLHWVKFVKNNCDTFEDIPNKFSANDIVEADCNSGKIYLNGKLEPSYGALGNDWEDFYLTAGLNQIGFAYSDWVAAGYAPSFKVRYREVFL